MEPKQVVLLDAEPLLGMGDRLSHLLDHEPFHYRVEPSSFFDSAKMPWDRGPELNGYPDLVFLLSFSRHLEACGAHLQKIRALPIRIPVIAVCEDLPSHSLRRLFQMGLDDFVATPLRDEEARFRISKVFDRAAAPPGMEIEFPKKPTGPDAIKAAAGAKRAMVFFYLARPGVSNFYNRRRR